MSKSINRQETLANGLTVLGEINTDHKSCAMGFFVKTGSRDESTDEAGLSHFLEHMMFKGTASRSALEVNFELGNLGAQANAFTSGENTVYYSAIIPENFRSFQELLSDMLRPSLLKEEFDTEKNVILEEIALYQDRPQYYLYENANSVFFNGHPLGNSVLGTTESITAVTVEQMRDYFARRYIPRNMVLVATGNFDWDNFLDNAGELTKSWPAGTAGRSRPALEQTGSGKVFTKKKLSQAHILMMSPSCGVQDEERYALSLLSMIIGDGSGSKFYWQLVDKGLAEGAGADQDDHDGCGVFSAYASTEPQNVDKVSGIMRDICEDCLNFDDKELERAKSKLTSRMILGGELPMNRLMALGMEWNYKGRIHNLRAEVDKYKAVTKDQIRSALEKYPVNFSEYRLLPG